MPHYGIFFMIGGRGISYLITSILPLLEINPHYGIFVMIREWGLLPLREIMPHYGAPLWDICHDLGGIGSLTTSSMPLSKGCDIC